MVAVHAHGDPVLSLIPVQVVAGPSATLVHVASAPPAQVPTLCGSHDPWSVGVTISLQATFTAAGVHLPLKS